VLSSVYVIASIALLVFSTTGLHGRASWAVESAIAFVLVSLLTGWLPLKYGLQRLKNFEA
jgi:hypothetical protein